jgi:hypothetical protein
MYEVATFEKKIRQIPAIQLLALFMLLSFEPITFV